MPVYFLFIDNAEMRDVYCDFLIIAASGGEQAMGLSIQKYETALGKTGNDVDYFH